MATALYAMAINFDVTTEGGLAHLDNYLLTRSFISGHQPSRDDIIVFTAFGLPPRANLVNLTRWYTHVKGILDASFPGAPMGVVFDQIQTVRFEDNLVHDRFPGAPVGVVFDQIQTVRFEDNPVREQPSTPRGASGETARRAPEENARRAPEETARGASGETGHERNVLENGNHQNGDGPLHLVADEAHEEAEAMARRLQETQGQASISEGRVSAKSSILLDVKPWDDETDMKALEAAVRAVQLPGLQWGASKLEPVAFKISKLQITMTVEEDLISPETIIEEHLTAEPANEHIQSCDIVAWNKICK